MRGGSNTESPALSTNSSIAIVTRPGDDEAYMKPIYRFLDILAPVTNETYLVAGDYDGQRSGLDESSWFSVGSGTYTGIVLLDYVILQLFISLRLLQLRLSVDIVYFHKGAMGLALPVAVSRIIGKKACVIKVGAFADERTRETPSIREMFLTQMQRLSFRMATAAVVFTSNERETVPNARVYVSYSNYRDFDQFKPTVPLEKRPYDIGFVGRFVTTKGIDVLTDAVVELTTVRSDIDVCLVGDGPEFETVQSQFESDDCVHIPGWVSPSELPSWYNRIKVLVIPSEAEGLPTVLIEAMACGTVVIATPTGSIPALIEDGETGFLLQKGSTCDIVATCDRVLNKENLTEISETAREYVVERYSREAASARFADIQADLIGESST